MGDKLQDKPRKELKELCSQNNIRTAGVKHEDLVRLLRNKLYPQTPRSTKTRGPKGQSPVKDNGDSCKTPVKTTGKGRNLRTLLHENESQQEVTPFRKKSSGLSRKPLLTKSNTFSSRRTGLRTKAPGVDQEAQENAFLHQNSVRRLCQVNGLSPLSRRSAEAPGQLESSSNLSSVRSGEEVMAQTDSNANTEDLTNPGVLEGSSVDPSDAGSDASRRVSEIATDAGPDTMSDFSDADEFRSVSSEPISRLSSLSKRSSLRSESSKMSLLSARSGLSFFTAGSWGSDNSRSLDSLLASVEGIDTGRGDVTEDIFPEFPEGSGFLIGDTDALELSFLDAGYADPEVIVNGKDHGVKADRFDAMDSPMARDYVNYNRGSEADGSEDCVGTRRVYIAESTSGQDAAEAPVNAADKRRESPAALPSEAGESKELGRINDESLPKNDLAPGTEAIESKRSSSGDIAKEDLIAVAGVADDTALDDSQPHEIKIVGNPSEIASNMDHLDVDGWGVDTPTQSESCSREDVTSSISNGVTYSEGQSSHAEPTPEDTEDEAEVHSGLPEGEASSESGTPAFDSRDFSVAKKLEFEPVEITQLAPLRHAEDNVEDKEVDGSHVQNPKGPAIRVPETIEDEDSAAHFKASSDEHPNTDNGPLPQPYPDMSSVTPSVNHSDSSATHSSGDNTAPELDRSGCPADEQEGYNVKSRDEQCASTCEPVHNYNKNGREKEDIQPKLSFPLSIILWCSQACSPISGNRSRSLTS